MFRTTPQWPQCREPEQRHFSRPLAPHAFTLVELLVVIGIIAVLVGILLPTLGRARESANAVKCMANMRQMGTGIQIYAGEYKGSLPVGYARQGMPTADGTYQGEDHDWTTLLMKVLSRQKAIGYTQDAVGSGGLGLKELFQCPTVYIPINAPNAAVTHYSSHPRLMNNLESLDSMAMYLSPGPTRYLRPYKLARVKRAAEIAVVFEGAVTPTGTGQGYGANSTCNVLDQDGLGRRPYLIDQYNLSVIPGIGPNDSILVARLPGTDGFNEARDLNKDTTPNRGNLRFRHKGDTQTNCLMLDGHVQAFTFNPRTKKTDLLRKNVYVNR